MDFLKEHKEGTLVYVTVHPRACKNGVGGIHDGTLRVRITAAPVEGAANRQCVKLLAKTLGVPKSRIRIIRGEKARKKAVLIEGVVIDHVLSVLKDKGCLAFSS